MGIREKIQKKSEEWNGKITKAKIEALQDRDKKIRAKKKLAEPGTIRYGLLYKQSPIGLTQDVIARRRRKREQKHN